MPKITRTKDWKLPERVEVYPNPFSDMVTFQWLTIGNHQIRIFDAQGQLISQQQVTGTQFDLNTASFANGMYYFHLIDQDGNWIDR